MEADRVLFDLAQEVRSLFCQLLNQHGGTCDVTGGCLYAAAMLAQAVRQFSGFDSDVRGGGPGDGGGFVLPGGEERGHYWVEAREREGEGAWVVDITADQFGDSEVVVLALAQAAHRYRPGSQAAVEEALREEGLRLTPAPAHQQPDVSHRTTDRSFRS